MKRFWVLDVETTVEEDQKDNQVVEVGGVLVHGHEAVRSYESLVKPTTSIGPRASAIHHITDADVADAPDVGRAVEPVLEEPADYYVAHNAAFDSMFLHMLPGPWICTYKCALRVYPDAPSYGNQVLRYWLGVDSPKASGYAHRALYDAEVTANVFVRMMQDAKTEDFLERMVAISSQPALQRKVGFGAHYGKLWSEVPADYLRWMLRTPEKWDEDRVFTAEYWLRKSR